MRAPGLVRPPRLRSGDLVALLSPASAPASPARLLQARRSLEGLGLRVRAGRAAARVRGYLAGSDAARAADLATAFRDPEVRGIFCTRGGYGSSRLLEHFDPLLARRRPKAVVGYSDLTVLHLALQQAGVVSFWGPMPGTGTPLSAFSRRWLEQALMSERPLGPLPNQGRAETLRTGRAEGRLTGGTLTLLAASLGTPYAVQTAGRIVFLEDVGEEPYKLDRMLTHLLAAGRLWDAAGIALGRFADCGPHNFPASRSLSLREVWADRLRPLGIPVFTGLAVGHTRDQLTLPYGVRARIDAGARRLTVLEPGVV
jgi:muramoyltetrapeptide carboxypeptidase